MKLKMKKKTKSSPPPPNQEEEDEDKKKKKKKNKRKKDKGEEEQQEQEEEEEQHQKEEEKKKKKTSWFLQSLTLKWLRTQQFYEVLPLWSTQCKYSARKCPTMVELLGLPRPVWDAGTIYSTWKNFFTHHIHFSKHLNQYPKSESFSPNSGFFLKSWQPALEMHKLKSSPSFLQSYHHPWPLVDLRTSKQNNLLANQPWQSLTWPGLVSY